MATDDELHSAEMTAAELEIDRLREAIETIREVAENYLPYNEFGDIFWPDKYKAQMEKIAQIAGGALERER